MVLVNWLPAGGPTPFCLTGREPFMIQETSLLARQDALRNVCTKREKVFDCLKLLGRASNELLSKELCWPINSVTPRIKELREERRVFYVGDFDNGRGRRVMFWSTEEGFVDV